MQSVRPPVKKLVEVNPLRYSTGVLREDPRRARDGLGVGGHRHRLSLSLRLPARAPGDDNGRGKEQGGGYALPDRKKEVAEYVDCDSSSIHPSGPAR